MTESPRIAVVLLAAGGSTRMRGRDKLLEDAGDGPLLRRVAVRASASAASYRLAVFGAHAADRRAALAGLKITGVENGDWASGMAGSIAAGIAALPPETDGAVIVLGDMPDITAALIDRLIAGFDPAQGKDIVRPVSASGPAGNPVLFGRRHFPALMALTGDSGAKPVIAANRQAVVDLPTGDDTVLTDLDTPEAWAAWRKSP